MESRVALRQHDEEDEQVEVARQSFGWGGLEYRAIRLLPLTDRQVLLTDKPANKCCTQTLPYIPITTPSSSILTISVAIDCMRARSVEKAPPETILLLKRAKNLFNSDDGKLEGRRKGA